MRYFNTPLGDRCFDGFERRQRDRPQLLKVRYGHIQTAQIPLEPSARRDLVAVLLACANALLPCLKPLLARLRARALSSVFRLSRRDRQRRADDSSVLFHFVVERLRKGADFRGGHALGGTFGVLALRVS